MKTLLLTSCAVIALFTACNNAEKKTEATPIATISGAASAIPPNPYWIRLDSTGSIMFNNKKMDLEQLQKELVDTLSLLKKNGGTMPDTIMYITEGTVMMGMRGAVRDAIQEAQDSVKQK